jgi:Tfp pilus assembly protein PilN
MTLPSTPQAPTPTAAAGTSGIRLPKVNLLPQEIHEAAKFRRFQLAMGGAGLATVVVVAGLALMAHHDVTNAKSQLSVAQAQNAQLRQQVGALQYVSDIRNQVDSRKAMLQQAMGTEIRWSYYLADLSLRIPDHVWLTAMQAAEAGAPGATSTSSASSPVTAGGIGSVSFSGVAFTHDDVANWLDALAKEKGYANPYFSSSTRTLIGSRAFVTFASSVSLTSDALSGRYNAVEG